MTDLATYLSKRMTQIPPVDNSSFHRINKNKPLRPGNIPVGVTKVEFYDKFDHPVRPGDIPTGVTQVHFGDMFNQALRPGDIPNTVTELVLGSDFEQALRAGDIPNSVTHLHVYRPFNRDDILPSSITHLTFNLIENEEQYEGQPLNIPSSVTHIKFDWFCEKLKQGDIPEGVTHVRFDMIYDQPFDAGVIPNSVTHLMLSTEYSHPLSLDLISKLELLVVHNEHPLHDPTIIKSCSNSNTTVMRYVYHDAYVVEYNGEEVHLDDVFDVYDAYEKYKKFMSNKNNFIGNIILEELVKRVFSPPRLFSISTQYNVEFTDLMDIY